MQWMVLSLLVSWAQLSAAPKEEQTMQQIAVNYFNKQAKLKPISTSDKEFSYDLKAKQDEKKGLWGFVDSRDKWIMKPVFDDVYDFGEDNCAIVKFDGYWGVIDRSQTFCIVPFCTEIQRSSVEGLFIASCPDQLIDEYKTQSYSKKRESDFLPLIDNTKAHYYIVRRDGTFLIDERFESISEFDADCLSIVSTSSGFGLLQSDGLYVLDPRFDKIDQYALGMYKVKEGINYGIVSKDGSALLSASFDIIEPWISSGLIWIRNASNRRWGAIDAKGKTVVQTQLDEKPSFTKNSIIAVSSNGKYGLMNADGKFISKCKDELIEQVDDRFWVMRKTGHYGYYTVKDDEVCYVELPHLSEVKDGKDALGKYRSRYSPDVESSRVWLRGLKQASFYSIMLDDKESSFLFDAQGYEFELIVQWKDTVCLHMKNLQTKKSWHLDFKRPVGLFLLDNEGNRREMFTNEYVFGTYDYDRDGADELVIAMRDNSTPMFEKPSGGCYGVLRIKADGDLSWIRSGRFSDQPVDIASFSNGSIKAQVAEISTSSDYPRVENFGLQGPVMTTGFYSFNYEGYLTAIGKYHISYGSDNIPRLVGNYESEGFDRNYRITRFDQKAIVISYEIDCSFDGNYREVSDVWFFNSQGLLEFHQPFSCNGGHQMYFIYDERGRLKYEMNVPSYTLEYQPQAAFTDMFGNWIEHEALVHDRVNKPSSKIIKRTIEYYTESESGK